MRMRRRSAVCLMQSTTPLSLWLMQRVRAQVGARDAQRRRLVPCRLHCRTRIRGPLPIVHASRGYTLAKKPLDLVGTGCRGRGRRAAKEDQAEGAVGEKAHVIALLRAGVPRGDIAGVAARRDLRHGAGALGRARALAAGRDGGTARQKLLTVYSLLNTHVCLVCSVVERVLPTHIFVFNAYVCQGVGRGR